MRQTHWIIVKVIAVTSIAYLLVKPTQAGAQSTKQTASKTSATRQPSHGNIVYAKYCAACHGSKLTGASATALIKKEWKHGSDRASLYQVIANGVPKTEMIKWSGTLTPDDIAAVTDFIIRANAAVRSATAKTGTTAVSSQALSTSPSTRKSSPKTLLQQTATQPSSPTPQTINTQLYTLQLEHLVTAGLSTPWGIEFVDAHRALITTKNGELHWMINGKLDTAGIKGLPKTYALDQVGGMMDLALDPEYPSNGWIYIAFSHNPQQSADSKTPGMTKIVRGKINGKNWTDEQTLFQVPDSLLVKGGTRWGCRFLFDTEGHLFFSIGDMNRADDAQLTSQPSGKVYRINPDGSIPADNPWVNQPPALAALYSIGNRNVQGIAQHPITKTIYASEHGPKGGDELNILRKGANYGWPVITFGVDYDGSIVSNDTAKAGMEQPITYWTPSIAVSAIEFVHGNRFPLWQNNLLVGALAFQEIRRLVIDNDKVLQQEILLKGYGRIRDLKFGPDGYLYVLTNDPDEVLRIIPAER